MPPSTTPARPKADACYLALKARDARSDGCFVTGVTSAGSYCRVACRVRSHGVRTNRSLLR